MKISLDNKLEFLYQWDIDRKIIITGTALDQEVHFATKDLDEALVVKPKEENGNLTCNIPNILLQDTKDIVIYLYDGHKTFFSKAYKIIARKKPADYVYNETEILTYEKLAKELKEMIATRANGIDYSNNKLSLYSDGKEIASTDIVTDDYRPLQYKPSINDMVLEGNKSLEELGIQPAGEYVVDRNYVHTDNNYTNEEKEKLDSLENYNDTEIRNIVKELNNNKQDKLVSGQNIKTINNESILGSGNFELPKSPITVVNDERYIPTDKDGVYYIAVDLYFNWTINNQTIKIRIPKNNLCLVTARYPHYEGDLDYSVLIFTDPDNCIHFIVRNNKDGSKIQEIDFAGSVGDIMATIDLLAVMFEDVGGQKEAGKLVITGEYSEESGINRLNTSGIGKGLKLENQELSVNTEGLDISKATIEDAVAGIDKTELISLIKMLVKENLQIKSVSTGLKFENGVLSLDISNGDNLKYGTLK